MQQALEQAQKQLEKEQQEGKQRGFNRSKSAAEKNNLKNQDPFEQMRNDPFFQDFFGNDPFFNQQFQKPKARNQLNNPNEKDW